MNGDKIISVVFASLQTGGAERVMINLANEFTATGHSCDLVVLDDTGKQRDAVSEQVNVVSLKTKRARSSVKNFSSYLRERNPDVLIVAQTHIQIMVCIAARRAKWKGRLILNEHSLFSRN